MVTKLAESKQGRQSAETFINIFGSQILKELHPTTTTDICQRKEEDAEDGKNVNNKETNFYSCDLDEKNIVFVDSGVKFKEMLNYFEINNIDVIGGFRIFIFTFYENFLRYIMYLFFQKA